MTLRTIGIGLLLLAILLPGFVAAAFPISTHDRVTDPITQACVDQNDQACRSHVSEKSVAWGYTSGCPYDCLMKLRNAFNFMIALKGGTFF